MVAATVPYEGDGASPLMQHADKITLSTPEELKAEQEAENPEDNLQIGGFERLSHFMSATR